MSPKEDLCCDICGDLETAKFMQTLPCSHNFHYECIMKTFMSERKRKKECPLCRKQAGLLPIVNGLTKLIKDIHYNDLSNGLPEYTCVPCNIVLKTGKHKGGACGKKCMLGFTKCKRHHLSDIKLQMKSKNKQYITA
jgi:hypothetical protein